MIKLIKLLIMALFIMIVFFLYAICHISSKCSKMEEIEGKKVSKEKDIEALVEKLERCRNISLDEVTFDDVDDIFDIKIDKRKPNNEKIFGFLNKVKNPYIFKVNDKLVRMRFSDKKDCC